MENVRRVVVETISAEKMSPWRWTAYDRDGEVVDYSAPIVDEQAAFNAAAELFPTVVIETRVREMEIGDGA